MKNKIQIEISQRDKPLPDDFIIALKIAVRELCQSQLVGEHLLRISLTDSSLSFNSTATPINIERSEA